MHTQTINKKDNRNELTDEDILNEINPTDNSIEDIKIVKDKKDDSPVEGSDCVDSSLFFLGELDAEELTENEQLSPKQDIKNTQQTIKNTDIQKPKTVFIDNVPKVQGPKYEEAINNDEVSVVQDDVVIIKGNETDVHGSLRWIKIILIVAILIVLVVGVYLWINNKEEEKISNQVEATVSENIQDSKPEETLIIKESQNEINDSEIQKINPLKMKIEVFNGGGVAGAAGKIKDLLVAEKYENVEAKNYPSDKKAETIVYYKEDAIKEEAQRVVDLLKMGNVEMQIKLASKDEEKTADIVIVLGK